MCVSEVLAKTTDSIKEEYKAHLWGKEIHPHESGELVSCGLCLSSKLHTKVCD